MTSDIPQSVIDRIRKMLALANDAGASEGERDNAMRAVHAYLAKYNLDLAAVGSTPEKPKLGEVAPRHQHRASFYGRPWARLICQGVAELMFCRYVFLTATQAKNTIHVFIGSHANSVSASLMAEFLVSSVWKEGKRRTREAMAGNAYFRSFATGAAHRIAQRCVALREAAMRPGGAANPAVRSRPATPQPPGTAIVLADVYEREAAANNAFLESVVKPRTDNREHFGKRIDPDALVEGARYGNTVSLDRQLE